MKRLATSTEMGFEAQLRQSAMTRQKKLEQAATLPADSSEAIHTFPNNWTLRQLKNYGDVYREGELMSNCFSPKDDEAHRIWDATPWDRDGLTDDILQKEIHEPIWSLRDEDNLPHASIDAYDKDWDMGGVALGSHNAPLKEEYAQMLRDYMDGYPGNPLSQHGVGQHSADPLVFHNA